MYNEYSTNLRLNGQFPFCPNFLVFDSYQGCKHGCKYCFANWGFHTNISTVRSGNKFDMGLRQGSIKSLRKMLTNSNSLDSTEKLLKPAFDKKMPLHWGSLSDPFQEIQERGSKISLLALQLLAKHEYPYVISTKGIMYLDKEYRELLSYSPENVFQTTIIGLDKIRPLEAGAPHPLERLDAITRLADDGIYTVVRMQPLFANAFTDEDLEDFIKKVSEAKVKALTAEMFKICSFKDTKGFINGCIADISKDLGFDIQKYYKDNGLWTNSDIELKDRIKYPLLKRIAELCAKYKLDFYCADNSMRLLGNGPICCGFPEGFNSSEHKGYMNRVPFICREKGICKFSDVYDEHDILLNTSSGNFLNRKVKGRTWITEIKELWNNPVHRNNPANFFSGVKVDDQKDEHGNIIFRYDKDWEKRIFEQKDLMRWVKNDKQ